MQCRMRPSESEVWESDPNSLELFLDDKVVARLDFDLSWYIGRGKVIQSAFIELPGYQPEEEGKVHMICEDSSKFSAGYVLFLINFDLQD